MFRTLSKKLKTLQMGTGLFHVSFTFLKFAKIVFSFFIKLSL